MFSTYLLLQKKKVKCTRHLYLPNKIDFGFCNLYLIQKSHNPKKYCFYSTLLPYVMCMQCPAITRY